MELPLHPANGPFNIGERVPFQKKNGIKKTTPLPLLQILPSPTFLLDATAESYNRDPSLLSSQKNHTLNFHMCCNILKNAANLGFGSRSYDFLTVF